MQPWIRLELPPYTASSQGKWIMAIMIFLIFFSHFSCKQEVFDIHNYVTDKFPAWWSLAIVN